MHLTKSLCLTLVSTVATLALFSACGDGGGSEQSSSTPDVSSEEFHGALWDARCEAAFECPNSRQRGLVTGFAGAYGSLDACKSDMIRREEGKAQLAAALEAGRVEFDADRAGACVAETKEALCDPSRDATGIEACADAIVGTVAQGENCAAPEECSEGLKCKILDNECYGPCEPPDRSCGDKTCSEDQVCIDSVCESPRGAGQECQIDQECEGSLRCMIVDFTGACTEPQSVGEGDPCGGDVFCGEGLVCVGPGGEKTCTSASFSAGDGANCDPQQGTFCEPGLKCIDGTCEAARTSGGACSASDDCAAGFYCDGFDTLNMIDGTCQPLKDDGETCSTGSQCKSFICEIDDVTMMGTCVAAQVCSVP